MPTPKSKPKINPAFIEPSLDDPEKDDARAMYIMGWTAAEIEKETGMRADRIRKLVEREGWAELKRKCQAAYAKKHPLAEMPITQAVVSAKKGDLKKKFVENMGQIAAEDSEHWKQMAPEERLVVATDIVALAGLGRKTFELDKEAEAGSHGLINLHFLNSADQPGFVKILEPAKVVELEDAK